MFSVRNELGFYIPEDGILHIHRRENLKAYRALTDWALYRIRNLFPVRYELGSYIPEDGIFVVTPVKAKILNLNVVFNY
jgi:hypothetical protein